MGLHHVLANLDDDGSRPISNLALFQTLRLGQNGSAARGSPGGGYGAGLHKTAREAGRENDGLEGTLVSMHFRNVSVPSQLG